MAIKTDTVTINGTQYKHTYSTTGHMITRNDNKQFVEAYDPTTSSYTYTESTLLALQSLGARLSALETSHEELQQEHDALEALPHIIETGTSEDGLSWYKLYSDKCCVQHGHIKAWSNNPQITITLLKSYANVNYVVWTQDQGTTFDSNNNGITVRSKTTSAFILDPYTNNRYGYWYTIGYVT